MRDGWFCRLPEGGVLVASALDRLAAWALIGWAWLALAVLAVALQTRNRRLLWVLAVSGGGFQVGHLVEHWGTLAGFSVSTSEPTVTWWAAHLVAGLADVLGGGTTRVGLEAMHFHGDLIFWCGVMAWFGLVTGRETRWAVAAQSVHMAEHVSLLVSTLALGRPVGLTVTGGVVFRVVIHWTLNMVGSAAWAASVWSLWRTVTGRPVVRRLDRRWAVG